MWSYIWNSSIVLIVISAVFWTMFNVIKDIDMALASKTSFSKPTKTNSGYSQGNNESSWYGGDFGGYDSGDRVSEEDDYSLAATKIPSDFYKGILFWPLLFFKKPIRHHADSLRQANERLNSKN
ncbi:MAG: hypothetical protein KME60_34250 [Cyanomargarita calcarea GSE-NOS-MK-12-04C]|jgi:hypothetical protein|uniref:Uncharacterized protein n=1 Tax=Cyanomargarita calcarea GSE-NOS-MK-12-04C TaxID=2839659 RepID=A0A951QVD5_9CYAN|nr:hypothetical protein [Cyanomargarita calcarea GSE-NOS-MK-12-04C]